MLSASHTTALGQRPGRWQLFNHFERRLPCALCSCLESSSSPLRLASLKKHLRWSDAGTTVADAPVQLLQSRTGIINMSSATWKEAIYCTSSKAAPSATFIPLALKSLQLRIG
eukprot:6175248-Pleurochrysis_carterae.AAC.1